MDPKVRQLFKQLTYMAKDYPLESGGPVKFMSVCKARFRATEVSDQKLLETALAKGEHVIKGMFCRQP